MTYINKQWLLDQRPKGMPGDECWKLNEEEVRPLEKGEVLIKILYLSIDPYMRGRMNLFIESSPSSEKVYEDIKPKLTRNIKSLMR